MNLESKVEVLTTLYAEHTAWARHQESQRSSISSLLLSIVALLIAVIGFDNKIDINDLMPSFFIFITGILGCLLSYKYYSQFKFHESRIDSYKKKMSELTGINIEETEAKADKLSKGNFLIFSKIRLYLIWMTFHLLVIVFSIIILYKIHTTPI